MVARPVLSNLEPDCAVAAEDGRGPARLAGRAGKLRVARVEAGVAVEGEAAGAEDDAVLRMVRSVETKRMRGTKERNRMNGRIHIRILSQHHLQNRETLMISQHPFKRS